MANEEELIERPQIRISVRNLVEFIFRKGDIDKTKGLADPTNAMREGQKIHRKIQGHMGASYHPEVPLKFVYSFEDYDLGIEGRADGIIYDGDIPATIDEIKGVYKDLDTLTEAIEVHLAQAKCYGAIVAIQHELDEIEVQMTYCNIDTAEIKRFKECYTYDEITTWFQDVIDEYKKWSDLIYYWTITRNDSINQLEFPYDFRPGQKSLMSQVYNHIDDGENLFIQAPTGTGKTIAAIYPAVKQMGRSQVSRILYLTAKTITKTVAKDTFQLLHDVGAHIKVTEITARDKICPLDKRQCDPYACPFAKGHFDRINDALYEILTTEELYNRDIIFNHAIKTNVCPYELSLDIALFSDSIICDYNYAFDPNVALQRVFADARSSQYVLLTDEAHNLVDRARTMYSETLIKEEFLHFKKILTKYDSKLGPYFDKPNKLMLALKKECSKVSILEECDQLTLAVLRLTNRLEAFFDKKIEVAEQDEILEFYFKLLNFLGVTTYLDDKYCIYCDYGIGDEFRLHLFCVDPSYRLSEYIESVRSCIFFSATLLPIDYYKQLLTTATNPDAIYAHSIFDPEKRLLLVANDVTSKYTRRGPEEYKKFANYIAKIAAAKPGNYMVFCPSYAFMQEVYEQYLALGQDTEVIIQESNMDEEKREEFLNQFKLNRELTLVAFCVLGGIFSEGIDLTNDKLIGAIIIGTGLAQVNTEGNILSDHFTKHGKNGFDFAYRYPGMNKVMQAAGRVIRTIDDTGVIALLDERFLFSDTRSLFPREWSNYQVTSLDKVDNQIAKFYEDLG